MRVSVETTSGLERKLTVGVPADEVDSAVAKKLAEASKNVRLPGFRPGKVPMSVMKQRFGPGVRQEVLGDVIEPLPEELDKPAHPTALGSHIWRPHRRCRRAQR